MQSLERVVFGTMHVLVLVFFFFCAAKAMAEQEEPQAVIFMYHRFGETRYPSTNVTIKQFEEQLDFFAENNFTVLPVEEIVSALKNKEPLPDRTIGITIDDAYRSVYEVAYPRLKARGYPFTVFVATGAVDEGISAYMSWEQMREMGKNGAAFANHTQNHDYLVRKKKGESQEAWKNRMKGDITGAQDRLKKELGQSPALFAYPYGEYNLELMDLVKKLGYTAFGQHSGGVDLFSDRRALPRFPVAEAYADMESFRTKAFSLAMPVMERHPVDPVTVETRPQLTVSLAPGRANLDQLACYIGDRRMEIKWIEPGKRFAIQTKKDLPPARSRYNCTAPDREGDRYYWFSHPWLRVQKP